MPKLDGPGPFAVARQVGERKVVYPQKIESAGMGPSTS